MEHDIFFLPAFMRTGAIHTGGRPKLAPLTGSVCTSRVSTDPAHRPARRRQPRDIDRAGRTVAAIHGATAAHTDTEQAFRTRHVFIPIRLYPYLRATTLNYPECTGQPEYPPNCAAKTGKALVHGELSLKNILIDRSGPVYFDTESARSSDQSLCLNHLSLRRVWRPHWTGNYLARHEANRASAPSAGEHRHHP